MRVDDYDFSYHLRQCSTFQNNLSIFILVDCTLNFLLIILKIFFFLFTNENIVVFWFFKLL